MGSQLVAAAHVRSSACFGLIDCIRGLGAEPSRLTSPGRLDMTRLGDADHFISLMDFATLLEEAAFVTGHRGLGLHFAARYDIRKLGALGYLTFHGETLGECLRDYAAFYGKLQSHTRVAIAEARGQVTMTYHVKDSAEYDREQDAEFSTAILMNFARRLCGSGWKPTAVRFEHPRARHDHYEELLGHVRPEFGADENCFTFASECLDTPNPDADKGLATILRSHLMASESLPTALRDGRDVRRKVLDRLQEGQLVRIADIAAELGCSVRLLQRELAAEGLTFNELRAEAAMELGCRFLRTSKTSVTDIALQLGFSETSAFSRAFKSKVGMSPREYREHNAGRGS